MFMSLASICQSYEGNAWKFCRMGQGDIMAHDLEVISWCYGHVVTTLPNTQSKAAPHFSFYS